MTRIADTVATALLVVAMFFWMDFGQGAEYTWWALMAK